MNRRVVRGNHYGLILTGLILLIGGGLALARGFGALAQVSFFGSASPEAPLLNPTLTDYAQTHAWVWYAVAATAILVALWALRWILVQLRTDRVRGFQLEPDRRAGLTQLPAAALTTAVEDEVTSYQGVHQARARVTHSPNRPWLTLAVSAERGADLAAVRQRVHSEAIPHARQALERDDLPVLLSLRLDATKAKRHVR